MLHKGGNGLKIEQSVIICNDFLASKRDFVYFCNREDRLNCLCTVRTNKQIVELLKTKEMKKLIIMSLMAIFGLTTVSAQKTVVAQKNQQVFDVVEQMPEYPGGMSALLEYLMQNVKYPEDAEKQKIEGKVMASFIVETDGSISEIKVLKPVYPSLDAEAVRVVQGMSNWTPGKQRGQLVRVRYTLPIMFRLK